MSVQAPFSGLRRVSNVSAFGILGFIAVHCGNDSLINNKYIIKVNQNGFFYPICVAQAPLFSARASTTVSSRSLSIRVYAQRAVTKKVQVVLKKDIPDLGTQGTLKSVPVGYYRNYLAPQGLAIVATESILNKIQEQIKAEERARLEEKAKAQAMATALSTIGKFIIRKKVGEKDQIFGSVTSAEIVEAIKMQTGRELDRREVTVPEIKFLGTYDVSVKLHPEVVGSFKVVVQKDTSA